LSSRAESIQKILFCSTEEKRKHFCLGIGVMGAKLDGTKICQDIFYRVYQGLGLNLGKNSMIIIIFDHI